MEHRPLFCTKFWWGGGSSISANLKTEGGGFKKYFFMAGKSWIRAFRNFFEKLSIVFQNIPSGGFLRPHRGYLGG